MPAMTNQEWNDSIEKKNKQDKEMFDVAFKDIEKNGKMTIHLYIDAAKMLKDDFDMDEVIKHEMTGIWILAKRIAKEYKRRKNAKETK